MELILSPTSEGCYKKLMRCIKCWFTVNTWNCLLILITNMNTSGAWCEEPQQFYFNPTYPSPHLPKTPTYFQLQLPQQTTKIITPYTVYWEALNQILSNYSMILNFSALSFPLAFKPLMSITSLKRKNSYLNPKYSFDQCLLLTSLRNLNFFITSIYFIFYWSIVDLQC